MEFEDRNFTMISSSNDVDDIKGIVKGQAYSIISLFELKMLHPMVRLLKLRYPWGL